MIKKLSALLLLLLVNPVFAQDKVEGRVEGTLDDKAELKQRIKQLTTFEASFSQRVVDSDGREIMQGKGKVHLSHPSLIRWHAIEPDENLLVSDGKTLWVYNVDLEEATAISAKEAIDSTPFALLASSDDALWRNYNVSKQDDAYVISPVEQQGQVKQLSLYFKDQQFSRLIIEDLSKQTSEFTFIKPVSNQTLDKKLFTFTLPEGVELDDQRQ
ncbi:MAG: outer membrane lipoprotein chaperone LolA [Algicola sp.]|nr:outer membrane lipoprotein chaperone LolA [Algicola sp.]